MLFKTDKDTFFQKKITLNHRGSILVMQSPVVMGILNLTPDSFFDGGRYLTESQALKQAEKMLSEGAAIIDVGAVSTRPGAETVDYREEHRRLFPVLKKLAAEFPEAILSVDTTHHQIAEEALNTGASIINDISGGSFDEEMFATVSKFNAAMVIMHIRGTPADMQDNPQYDNVVKEVMYFLSAQVRKAREAGIADIIIDPGFGFGKTVRHNFELLANLELFGIFQCPVLVGLSRKSMINKTLGIKPESALNGTTVLNTIALLKNADILRVHDVREAIEAIKLIKEVKDCDNSGNGTG